jgi:hypothetical protein
LFDVAGLVDNSQDRVVSTWNGTSGTPTGTIYRWRIDWTGNCLIQESSTSGDTAWCYYMTKVSPLAMVDNNIISGGAVITSNALAAVNIAANFNTPFLDASDGWGRTAPGGVLDSMGINSGPESSYLYIVLRRTGDVYELYSVSPSNGSYTYQDFSFTWTGNTSSITASAGDALGRLPAIPGDFNGDGDVDGDDLSVFESCVSGPTVHYTGDCAAADFDQDNDVDQSDFGIFQRCYRGENKPGDPTCAN